MTPEYILINVVKLIFIMALCIGCIWWMFEGPE